MNHQSSHLMNPCKALALLILLLFSVTALAAVPHWISYQGYLARPDGTPLDTTVSITFRLYPEFSSVSPIWDEIADVTTVNGIYNVLLGAADNFPQTFFDDGSMWLGIQVGTDAEMSPRIDLAAVPYAYRIGTIDEAAGGTISGDVVINGKLNAGTANTNGGANAMVLGTNNIASGDYSIVGGGQYNRARGVYSVIAGGGGEILSDTSSAVGDFSTISGGARNLATGAASTIAGGYEQVASGGSAFIGGGNYNQATADGATISGGTFHQASGMWSTIAGGQNNRARGLRSTVGGGGGITADSNSTIGDYSVIAGGRRNRANGLSSTIAGGYSNIADGIYSSIGGGRSNSTFLDDATVGGGNHNVAGDYYATVSGGGYNFAYGQFSVIAGGGGDDSTESNNATGNYSVIGGGYNNNAHGDASCIAGGYYHTASGNSATIGGGYRNTSTSFYTTVGGGTYNDATGQYATIGGGRYNDVAGNRSTVGGGNVNTITTGSDYSTIAGGGYNTVGDDYNFIGGGGGTNADSGNFLNAYASVIGGGVANWMDHDSISTWYGVIGGGRNNFVGDTCATIPGGSGNTAYASYAFAAGRNASAWNRGAFVWSDASSNTGATSSTDNEFTVRAAGGIRLFTNSASSSGMRLGAGGNAWIVVSDSTKKRNINPCNTKLVLEKVANLPIKDWEYKSEKAGTKHIGPMAQDFWNALHLGSDSLGIETLDADGVLFAAVKELANQVQELRTENSKLQSQIQSLMAGQAKAALEVTRESSK